MLLGIDHRAIASKHRRALKGMSQRAFSPCLSTICSPRVGDGSLQHLPSARDCLYPYKMT